MPARNKVALILEDGRVFLGKQVGPVKPEGHIGEVVFNTSLSGYQEIISDPSYKGQLVCFTYPSIGNYGTTPEDDEFDQPCLEAIIMRDYCDVPSNFRSTGTLEDYLNRHNIPGITGIDTRALVRHIREQGSMKGGLFAYSSEAGFTESCVKRIKAAPDIEGLNLTTSFKGHEANAFVKKQIEKLKLKEADLVKVAVLDFGIKFSILENFLEAGMLPIVFAGDTVLDEWHSFNADEYAGFFISNGPGDPAVVKNGIANIKSILEYKKPVFGICLGHQMLSLALGAETFKMKFGHHGGNQPVKDSEKTKIIITAQNHGFAVNKESLEKVLSKFQKYRIDSNPNDQTLEGFFIYDDAPVFSVQYHPEAGPGPHDARPIFKQFKDLLVS